MAGGSGAGRGKGVWGRGEARERKGGAWKRVSRGEDFCSWRRTGTDSGREQRGLESWWGEMSERGEAQQEVAVGDFQHHSPPFPQVQAFLALTLHFPGESDPHPKDLENVDPSPSPPHPQPLMYVSIP